MIDTSLLEYIGLTNAEVKIYLSLLELGPAKAGAIITKSKLQSSVVHASLHKLIQKGIISFVIKSKIRIYQASDPRFLLELIDDKRKDFENLLPTLLEKQNAGLVRNESKIYVGYKGVSTLLIELIADGIPGDEFLFIGADVENMQEDIQKYYEKYDKKRKEKGLIVKGVAPKRWERFFSHRLDQKHLNVRFSDMLLPPNMSIFRNKVAFFSWDDQPTGYMIYSEHLAEKFRLYFDMLWKSVDTKTTKI